MLHSLKNRTVTVPSQFSSQELADQFQFLWAELMDQFQFLWAELVNQFQFRWAELADQFQFPWTELEWTGWPVLCEKELVEILYVNLFCDVFEPVLFYMNWFTSSVHGNWNWSASSAHRNWNWFTSSAHRNWNWSISSAHMNWNWCTSSVNCLTSSFELELSQSYSQHVISLHNAKRYNPCTTVPKGLRESFLRLIDKLRNTHRNENDGDKNYT